MYGKFFIINIMKFRKSHSHKRSVYFPQVQAVLLSLWKQLFNILNKKIILMTNVATQIMLNGSWQLDSYNRKPVLENC